MSRAAWSLCVAALAVSACGHLAPAAGLPATPTQPNR